MTVQNITVLGSTGSIGVSTLDVIRRHPDRYRAFALCAHSQVDKLFEQCREFQPHFAVLRDATLATQLTERLRAAGLATEVRHGIEALIELSALPEVDAVMAAIVGAAGLEPTLAAARAGKRVMLANKEVLVMAGELFMHAVHAHGATLLPVDSEHNAIFQAFAGRFCPRSRCLRRASHPADGVGRSLPQCAARYAGACHAGTGLCPSELGDGAQDFG